VNGDEQWINGRLVDPAHPGICVHHVGTTSGMWCGACLEGPVEEEES